MLSVSNNKSVSIFFSKIIIIIIIDELDRMSGNITQHRLERLVMNDDIITPKQGIFASMRSHAVQSQVDNGIGIGIPSLSGMDDMIHNTIMDGSSHYATARHSINNNNNNNMIPNNILRFTNNNKNTFPSLLKQRSLLFDNDDSSDSSSSLKSSKSKSSSSLSMASSSSSSSTPPSGLLSQNMGNNIMAMNSMNINNDEAALKKKNLLRRKFGLEPIDMKEFMELEGQIAELDYQQQLKKKEADAMAAIEMEQRIAKQKQKEESGGNIFQRMFGDAVKDTCESNYDCQRPEVCCDMGFKKMCCSNGMRVFNAPDPRVLVPVTITPNPDPTIPPKDPRPNREGTGYY